MCFSQKLSAEYFPVFRLWNFIHFLHSFILSSSFQGDWHGLEMTMTIQPSLILWIKCFSLKILFGRTFIAYTCMSLYTIWEVNFLSTIVLLQNLSNPFYNFRKYIYIYIHKSSLNDFLLNVLSKYMVGNKIFYG